MAKTQSPSSYGLTKKKIMDLIATLENKAPMKVAEEGRTATEAKQIIQSRFPGAKIMFAEGF